jgi:hypothetical protein
MLLNKEFNAIDTNKTKKLEIILGTKHKMENIRNALKD